MWGEGTDLSNFFTAVRFSPSFALLLLLLQCTSSPFRAIRQVWLDLTAVAEKLWSGPAPAAGGLDLLAGDKHRLRAHRCRLVGMGLPVSSVGSVIYDPDASHASFATWRKWQWCDGDQNWGLGHGRGGGGGVDSDVLAFDVDRAAAAGMEWALDAAAAARKARARQVSTPFD